MDLDFENRPDRRDYDVGQSFSKIMNPAIVAYFVVCMGLAGVASMFLPPLATFYSIFLICILFGAPIIFGAAKKQDNQMEASHHGYNVQDKETRPFFWFGSTEFKKYRKDTGGFSGMRIGHDPFADKLDDRRDRQREMNCETCGEEIETKTGYEGARGRDVTGYFNDEYGFGGYTTWEA